MPSKKLHILFLLLAVCMVLTSSCRSPKRDVAKQMQTLRQEWQTNVAHQTDLPRREIDWPTALSEMLKNNMKLRQARLEVTNSQEAVRQIFRDLTPTLNLRAGLTRRIKDISATTVDDITFSADSFFNIPGLMSFGPRLYAARLFQLRAEAAAALAEREQVIELYKLFYAAQEPQEDARHIENEKTTAAALATIDPLSGQLLMTELELSELAAKRDAESLQQQAGDLLGNRSFYWVFQTNGLPELRYDLDPLRLDDTNRVAQLQIKLAAIELEAARAQMTGIKLRYWPELNIFVSGPPIYTRSGGQDFFWDADQLRASADVFWYLDTRGLISRQLRQLKRQQILQQERLRQETISLINRLIFTQTLLKKVREKITQTETQLQLLLSIPPAQNYDALLKYSSDYRALADQQRGLRRELAELNTLFWFVDEYAWRPPGTSYATNQ